MQEIKHMDLFRYMYISSDAVASSAICLVCQRDAWRYLQIIGGSRHNEGGNYCWVCGQHYVSMISQMDEYRQMCPDKDRTRASETAMVTIPEAEKIVFHFPRIERHCCEE